MNDRRWMGWFCCSVAMIASLVGGNLERNVNAAERPNILLILADDLGYGDVRCYNDQSKVPTPQIDRLAREGMRFTDAHSPCTVCTPTRYGLMTGQMPFRIPNGGTVFTGVGGPSLITADRLTLPEMLREHGYSTACVGKWHIGLTFYNRDGQPVRSNGVDAVRQVDFSRRIEGGPIDHGFQSFFGTACCPTTDWLYAFIENDRVPVPPTGLLDQSPLPKHPYANDCRPGLIAPNFSMEDVDLVFLEKSRAFLERHVRESPDKPFFLFHSTQAVHLPSFAAKPFQGKSPAGPHGDFLLELDHIVGELMATLERLGVAENTLVIFTSDNGPEVTSVVHMRADHAHDGARPWRGVKRDNWEGGHRVPFLVRWPGRVPASTSNSQLTSLTDVMATIAAIVGAKLPENAAEDSFNMLPSWCDNKHSPIRPYLLTQAFSGQRTLAIRRGEWKYIAHAGSGGNRYENHPELKPYILPEEAPDAPGQLYHLTSDPGETRNLYVKEPAIVAELKALLEESKSTGRSRSQLEKHDSEPPAPPDRPKAHPVPSSDQWLTYPGGDGPGKGKHIVLIAAEQEYRSEQSMPMMAKILSTHHGFDCTVLFGVNELGEVDPTLPVYPEKGKEAEFKEHHIPGLEHLASADLVIFFTRLLTLPRHEQEHIVKYIDSGKPIIALRTANHGFRGPLPYKMDGKQVRWGEDVLGGSFLNHHGRWHADSTRGSLDKDQSQHPILRGVSDIWGDSDVYRTYKEGTSLPSGCTALVWGQPLVGRKPDDPPNEKLEPLPVAWIKPWQTSRSETSRIFHCTMGSATDFKNAGLRRLVINAAYWGMGMESSISATRSVEIVGSYEPLESGFNYEKLGIKPRPISFYR